MSIDTLATYPTPADTVAVENPVSAWATLNMHLAAERATRNAALREHLDNQIVRRRTATELRADIAKFNTWLEIPSVQSAVEFGNWVRARKADAMTQLANLEAGAR